MRCGMAIGLSGAIGLSSLFVTAAQADPPSCEVTTAQELKDALDCIASGYHVSLLHVHAVG